jgi:hypothetical protein
MDFMARNLLVLAAAAAFATGGMASASIIELQLSTHSSEQDEPGGTLPDVLDATFGFLVVGNMLTLTVTNDTTAPNEYQINEVFFNASDNVTGMTFTSNNVGWTFGTNTMANGFGDFDFSLIDGNGGGPNVILPGASVVFTFTFTGIANEKDFTTAFSTPTNPDGDIAIIGAKFVFGPDLDSAYGFLVPSPGVLALLCVAGMIAGRRRRRES